MQQTRVAVLGTLAEFHDEPVPYDLAALVALVTGINPDLLCLDISPEQWQAKDFKLLTPEYRDALLPLANQSDIVVVPIGGDLPDEPPVSGPRGWLIARLRAGLAALQQSASGPDALNRGWRHDLANLLYHLMGQLAGGGQHRHRLQHLGHLAQRVVEITHRDPGCRVLVVVNVRYCHLLRPELRRHQELEVVSYTQL